MTDPFELTRALSWVTAATESVAESQQHSAGAPVLLFQHGTSTGPPLALWGMQHLDVNLTSSNGHDPTRIVWLSSSGCVRQLVPASVASTPVIAETSIARGKCDTNLCACCSAITRANREQVQDGCKPPQLVNMTPIFSYAMGLPPSAAFPDTGSTLGSQRLGGSSGLKCSGPRVQRASAAVALRRPTTNARQSGADDEVMGEADDRTGMDADEGAESESEDEGPHRKQSGAIGSKMERSREVAACLLRRLHPHVPDAGMRLMLDAGPFDDPCI